MSTEPVPAAFYCVADARYFLGAVGLVNSLRLVGHTEPIYLLDCGLSAAQRERLGTEVTPVPGPRDAPPWLQKTVAPLRHPADVMVLVDADVIVTRALSPLIERAAEGRVVAFLNGRDRFVAEWGELLELGPIERRRYVSSGLVLLGREAGAELLELLDDRQRRVDMSRTVFGSGDPRYPFRYPEQDVLNAILCTSRDPAASVRLPNRLAPNPPYRGLRVYDEATLRCAYADGAEPYVLHQFARKPWLEPVYHSVYSRLLLAADVAIRVSEDEVHLRLRTGLAARVARKSVDAADLIRWYARDVIPEWVESRVGAARRGGGDRS